MAQNRRSLEEGVPFGTRCAKCKSASSRLRLIADVAQRPRYAQERTLEQVRARNLGTRLHGICTELGNNPDTGCAWQVYHRTSSPRATSAYQLMWRRECSVRTSLSVT